MMRKHYNPVAGTSMTTGPCSIFTGTKAKKMNPPKISKANKTPSESKNFDIVWDFSVNVEIWNDNKGLLWALQCKK